MGKLSIKDLQLTGVKGASKLSTDENGNVVAGEDVGGGTSDEALAAQIIAQDDLFRKGVLKKVTINIKVAYEESSLDYLLVDGATLEGNFQIGDREYPGRLFSQAPSIGFYSLYFYLQDVVFKYGEEFKSNLTLKLREGLNTEKVISSIVFVQKTYSYHRKLPRLKLLGEKPVISKGTPYNNPNSSNSFVPFHTFYELPDNIIEAYISIAIKSKYSGKFYNQLMLPAPEKEMTLNISYENYRDGIPKAVVSSIFFGVGNYSSNFVVKEIKKPPVGISTIKSPAYEWSRIIIAFSYEDNKEAIGANAIYLTVQEEKIPNYQLRLGSGYHKHGSMFYLNRSSYSENHINVVIRKN